MVNYCCEPIVSYAKLYFSCPQAPREHYKHFTFFPFTIIKTFHRPWLLKRSEKAKYYQLLDHFIQEPFLRVV